MTDFGFGFRPVALREGDDGGANPWRCQPPAVIQQPPWQSRSPELKGDDLCHAPTMRRRLAAFMRGVFRSCVFLCRFCAEYDFRVSRFRAGDDPNYEYAD